MKQIRETVSPWRKLQNLESYASVSDSNANNDDYDISNNETNVMHMIFPSLSYSI